MIDIQQCEGVIDGYLVLLPCAHQSKTSKSGQRELVVQKYHVNFISSENILSAFFISRIKYKRVSIV